MSDIKRLTDETLEYLCNDYSGDASHRVTMRAAFEIFAFQIIFRENNEYLLMRERVKQNALNRDCFRWLFR